MNPAMNDQYVDKFLEACMNGELSLLEKLLKGRKLFSGKQIVIQQFNIWLPSKY